MDLERCILDARPSIEHWLRNQWQKHVPPFYCSIYLRNRGSLCRGGFYRFHTGRGTNEKLNALGMQFVSLAFEGACLLPNAAGYRRVLAGCHGQLVPGLWCDSPTGVTGCGARVGKKPSPSECD